MECRPYGVYAVYDVKRWWLFLLLPSARVAVTALFGVTAPLLWWELLPAALLISYSVAKWYTCRYRLTASAGDRFHTVAVRQGLLTRHTLHISAEDAASVEVERTPLLWLLGGRRIRISTAGLRRRADAVLYLPAHSARRLFSLNERGAHRTRARVWPVAVMALSGSNAAVGLLTAAPLLRHAGQLLGQQFPQDVVSAVEQALFAGLPPLLRTAANLLVVGWALSALNMFLRYVGFYAQCEGEHLHLVSGLFTRRDVLIDRGKITALELRQTLGMRLLDLHTAVITAAGYGRDVGARPVLVPAARPRELCACLNALLPDFPVQVPRLRTASRFRYVWAPLTCLLSGMAVATRGGWWQWAAALWILAAAWWLLVRILASAHAGFGMSDSTVALCYPRGLALVRVFLPREVTDCLTVTQTPFQRRRGVCTVQVRCFGEKRRRHRVWGVPYAAVNALLT